MTQRAVPFPGVATDVVGPRRHVAGALRLARRKPMGAASLVAVALLWVVAVFAPMLGHFPADQVFAGPRLAAPSASYWLGTDEVGRDVYTRLLYGARLSLSISVAATVIGILGGTIIGVVSGYFLGAFDLVVQRLIDALIAMPTLVVLMVIAFVTGGGLFWVTLAVAFITIPSGSRVIRASTISVAHENYIEAARTLGASHLRIMARHVLPNVFPTVLVLLAINLGQNILLQSSLSFLGLVSSQSPDWGAMLNVGARRYMLAQPWLALSPGIAISVAVLAYNLLGDALRDVLDPRLRGT